MGHQLSDMQTGFRFVSLIFLSWQDIFSRGNLEFVSDRLTTG